MKHGYGERWKDLSLTVDKVGEDKEGNHLVEVSIHDRMDEVHARVYVSKEYYGSMIPWLAARVVVSDLAASPLDRVRRLEARRLESEVWYENREDAKKFDAFLGLSDKMHRLPEYLLRGTLVFLPEGSDWDDVETATTASIHNAHKLIFDYGLPDVLEFVMFGGTNINKKVAAVEAKWSLVTKKIPYFFGFDWRTPVGAAELEEFLEMLNVKRRISPEEIRPQWIRRREGPKEWSPHEMQSFMLIKGRDYGRQNG